jgi:hypothetical protein
MASSESVASLRVLECNIFKTIPHCERLKGRMRPKIILVLHDRGDCAASLRIWQIGGFRPIPLAHRRHCLSAVEGGFLI